MAIIWGNENEETARANCARDGGVWVGKDARYGLTLYTYHTHLGCVIQRHTRSWFMDNFYTVHSAEVWNGERCESIDYFCDRDDIARAWVREDATPEVLAARQAQIDAAQDRRFERAKLEELMTPCRGKRLEVIKGRKVPKGTVGECFWTGESQFGPRVGLRTAEGQTFFTALQNVQVV